MELFVDPPQSDLSDVKFDEHENTIVVAKPFSGFVGLKYPIPTKLNNTVIYLRVRTSFSSDLVHGVTFQLYGIQKGRQRRGTTSTCYYSIGESEVILDNQQDHTIQIDLTDYDTARQLIAVVITDASKMVSNSFMTASIERCSQAEGIKDSLIASGDFVLADNTSN